jgi:hypothetical protein
MDRRHNTVTYLSWTRTQDIVNQGYQSKIRTVKAFVMLNPKNHNNGLLTLKVSWRLAPFYRRKPDKQKKTISGKSDIIPPLNQSTICCLLPLSCLWEKKVLLGLFLVLDPSVIDPQLLEEARISLFRLVLFFHVAAGPWFLLYYQWVIKQPWLQIPLHYFLPTIWHSESLIKGKPV